MEFRLANNNDIENIAKLENECFKNPWTNEQYSYEIKENEFSKTIVIENDNNIIGYLNYWIIFDQATINKICVDKNYRNQGLASKLLNLAMEDIKNNQCIIVTLEVRISNVNAISLYKKYGFSTALKKDHYYADGEDAFYMVKGVE